MTVVLVAVSDRFLYRCLGCGYSMVAERRPRRWFTCPQCLDEMMLRWRRDAPDNHTDDVSTIERPE